MDGENGETVEEGELESTCTKSHGEGGARTQIWGRNSSVGSVLCSLSCVMQRRGFDPPLSIR